MALIQHLMYSAQATYQLLDIQHVQCGSSNLSKRQEQEKFLEVPFLKIVKSDLSDFIGAKCQRKGPTLSAWGLVEGRTLNGSLSMFKIRTH